MSATHAELRSLLQERRRQAERRIAARAGDITAVAAARGDATADDEHDPEGATLSGEWSRLAGLSDAARDELREIDAALGRIEAGTYGICEVCGEPIPQDRLRARPTASRCVRCAV
ncbi:TraR/DksA family transcriptional regulator [Microbacterium stercoris]|uniref:TraR/DksA C4-type zinc finger protein n=1 Tax=Microbacterium stercoris TaxID=2820289 RepID=A0A939TRC5_9MICO|nr:TraR/DksA C4-type zinc finger protein [Microbacterium stercoris]MBO3662388.1 TraR/DksA C4-type zinc finger protein [Microbacterium stercoris]MBO3664380.1 TraR/DksA C4-type zinc finger protein [Microbacterium stercoris]